MAKLIWFPAPGVAVPPDEADPKPVNDADAVLTGAVASRVLPGGEIAAGTKDVRGAEIDQEEGVGNPG